MPWRRASRNPRGTIRVSLPFGFGTDLRLPRSQGSRSPFREVELQVQCHASPVDITTKLIDVAFNVGPVLNESLPAVKISELHRGVYGSTRYCEQHGVPGSPPSPDRNRITLESQRASGLWTFGTGRRRSPVHSRVQVTDVATAYHMMRDELGFAILPNILCVAAVGSGEVRRFLHGWGIPSLPVTATSRAPQPAPSYPGLPRFHPQRAEAARATALIVLVPFMERRIP